LSAFEAAIVNNKDLEEVKALVAGNPKGILFESLPGSKKNCLKLAVLKGRFDVVEDLITSFGKDLIKQGVLNFELLLLTHAALPNSYKIAQCIFINLFALAENLSKCFKDLRRVIQSHRKDFILNQSLLRAILSYPVGGEKSAYIRPACFELVKAETAELLRNHRLTPAEQALLRNAVCELKTIKFTTEEEYKRASLGLQNTIRDLSSSHLKLYELTRSFPDLSQVELISFRTPSDKRSPRRLQSHNLLFLALKHSRYLHAEILLLQGMAIAFDDFLLCLGSQSLPGMAQGYFFSLALKVLSNYRRCNSADAFNKFYQVMDYDEVGRVLINAALLSGCVLAKKFLRKKYPTKEALTSIVGKIITSGHVAILEDDEMDLIPPSRMDELLDNVADTGRLADVIYIFKNFPEQQAVLAAKIKEVIARNSSEGKLNPLKQRDMLIETFIVMDTGAAFELSSGEVSKMMLFLFSFLESAHASEKELLIKLIQDKPVSMTSAFRYFAGFCTKELLEKFNDYPGIKQFIKQAVDNEQAGSYRTTSKTKVMEEEFDPAVVRRINTMKTNSVGVVSAGAGAGMGATASTPVTPVCYRAPTLIDVEVSSDNPHGKELQIYRNNIYFNLSVAQLRFGGAAELKVLKKGIAAGGNGLSDEEKFFLCERLNRNKRQLIFAKINDLSSVREKLASPFWVAACLFPNTFFAWLESLPSKEKKAYKANKLYKNSFLNTLRASENGAELSRLFDEVNEAKRIKAEQEAKAAAEARAKLEAEKQEARMANEILAELIDEYSQPIIRGEYSAAQEEEQARQAAEAARLAEEARQAAEEARLAEEARQAAEAARLAEEARQAAEEARLAEEARQAAEAARLAEEARQAAEEARLAEEARQAAEAARLAEEQARRAAEAARLAEEAERQRKQREEEARQAAEATRLAEEQARQAAEAARLVEEAELARMQEEEKISRAAEIELKAEEKLAEAVARENELGFKQLQQNCFDRLQQNMVFIADRNTPKNLSMLTGAFVDCVRLLNPCGDQVASADEQTVNDFDGLFNAFVDAAKILGLPVPIKPIIGAHINEQWLFRIRQAWARTVVAYFLSFEEVAINDPRWLSFFQKLINTIYLSDLDFSTVNLPAVKALKEIIAEDSGIVFGCLSGTDVFSALCNLMLAHKISVPASDIDCTLYMPSITAEKATKIISSLEKRAVLKKGNRQLVSGPDNKYFNCKLVALGSGQVPVDVSIYKEDPKNKLGERVSTIAGAAALLDLATHRLNAIPYYLMLSFVLYPTGLFRPRVSLLSPTDMEVLQFDGATTKRAAARQILLLRNLAKLWQQLIANRVIIDHSLALGLKHLITEIVKVHGVVPPKGIANSALRIQSWQAICREFASDRVATLSHVAQAKVVEEGGASIVIAGAGLGAGAPAPDEGERGAVSKQEEEEAKIDNGMKPT
jgi:hypothetical protein